MKKALLLIPAALLLFSCARTKRKGTDEDEKKKENTTKVGDNVKLNNSAYSLGLDKCEMVQLEDLIQIQNTVEIYNGAPNQANENAILNACMKYNNAYTFTADGQCEFLYNDQVVSTLQFSDALWDSVCSQFN
ncbi:hypothetical protein N9N67_03790 [Bacteriovoracaceae bacterium]|nr:hypothetical protein [Bacteriovoracaceae bacterium]